MDDQTTNPTQDPAAPATDQPTNNGGNDAWQPSTPTDQPATPGTDAPATEEPQRPSTDQTAPTEGEGQGETNPGAVS